MLSSVDDYTGDFGESFKSFHCTEVILLHFGFKTAVQNNTRNAISGQYKLYNTFHIVSYYVYIVNWVQLPTYMRSRRLGAIYGL